ncbi:MAG: oligosaccharide flippase family protein [Myxococcales bacterium]
MYDQRHVIDVDAPATATPVPAAQVPAASARVSSQPSTPQATPSVAHAAGWEVGSQLMAMALRLGSNLILTRLLYPEVFGLMSLLHSVLFVLALLSDVGLTQAVIASRREDREFLDTVWTIHAVRGLGLWLAAVAVAWPCALLLNEPTLLWLLPVGGTVSIFQGLSSLKPWLLRRRMRVVPLIKLELLSNLVLAATMIAMAKLGFGIAATVVGLLAQNVVQIVGSYLLPLELPRPRLLIDATAKAELVHFGRWIFFSSCLTAVINKGDQLLLGRLLGAAQLGIYQTALALSDLPELLVGRVISSVLMPALAQARHVAPHEFAARYYRVRSWLDPLTFTTIGGLMGMSDWVIGVLYDDRYRGAAPMLRLLCIRIALHIAATFCETCLFVQGQSMFGFRRNLFVSAVLVVAIPLGHYLGGVDGLLWGTIAARLTAFPALWPAAKERGHLWLRRELLPLPCIGAGYGLGKLAVWLLPPV